MAESLVMVGEGVRVCVKSLRNEFALKCACLSVSVFVEVEEKKPCLSTSP